MLFETASTSPSARFSMRASFDPVCSFARLEYFRKVTKSFPHTTQNRNPRPMEGCTSLVLRGLGRTVLVGVFSLSPSIVRKDGSDNEKRVHERLHYSVLKLTSRKLRPSSIVFNLDQLYCISAVGKFYDKPKV